MSKVHTIVKSRKGRDSEHTGTVAELTEYFAYTLATGKSYEHEKGNSKINTTPRTIGSLVNNLNKAVNNAAANGCSDTHYSVA